MPHRAVRRLEETESLDRVAGPASKAAGRAVRPRPVRNLLSGTSLGHPLHPVLTDVTIGAWGASAVLDAVGGPATEPASDLLVKIGIGSAVPTALSGANDWSDTLGPECRVGLVHAMANSAALGLYVASMVMRNRGNRRAGRALGWAGAAVMGVGGYLGGHLSYVQGVNVNRTAWQQEPDEWTPLLDDAELADRAPRRVDADGTPILLYRDGRRVYALAATCTHMGGPLDEGAIEEGCVTCPWHGSTFHLDDGGIERGPASTPQPHYETRVRDGRIEVRVPARDGQGEPVERARHKVREGMARASTT
ncbi:Rieske (2Fe-2S) protein [Actinomadura sediminis]